MSCEASSMFPPWWTQRFGDTAPLGYRLRAAFPSRWLRIHSLPASKRYAESAQDEERLLARQDAVARELLTSTSKLIAATFEPTPLGSRNTLEGFGRRNFECIASFRDPGDREGLAEDMDVSFHVSFWSVDSSWNLSTERSLLISIANDRRCALWMDSTSGEVFAPYDGGVDIIAADPARRDRLRAAFSQWLSPHPEGL